MKTNHDLIINLFSRIIADSGDKLPRSRAAALVANMLGITPLVVAMAVGIGNATSDLTGIELP